jgi:hypothetical protein
MTHPPSGSARQQEAAQEKNSNTTGLTNGSNLNKVGSNGNHQNLENGYTKQMAIGIDKQRPPYDKEKFEARGEILDAVNAHLQEAAQDKPSRPLIEIVGVTWIGKTWLLKHLEENYKRESNERVGNRPTISIYFDLQDVAQLDPSEADTYRWYTRFLERFVPVIERASGDIRPKELEILKERKSDWPLPPDELQKVLNSLRNWFAALRRGYFPILLLDSLEQIDAALLAWLEYEILVPFVEGKQALIITAGRQQVKWREYEIRFYSDLIRLGVLEEWGTRGDKGVPKWIHERYALGHPGLAAKLSQAFQTTEGGLDGIRALNGTPDEQTKVGRILEETINEIVLNDVPTQNIPGRQMDLRAILWTIAVLRKFSPEILNAMVDRFGPDLYRGKSYVFFRQASFDLVDCHVAAWRAGINDYRVEPLVRRILANAVRIANGPEAYLERHQAAEEWYRTALQNAPSTASHKLPELLYHYCARVKALEPNALSEKAVSETQALLHDPALAISQGEVDTLKQRFTNKDDDDLEELRRDMLALVGERTYQKILDVLQEFSPVPEPTPVM